MKRHVETLNAFARIRMRCLLFRASPSAGVRLLYAPVRAASTPLARPTPRANGAGQQVRRVTIAPEGKLSSPGKEHTNETNACGGPGGPACCCPRARGPFGRPR